MEEGLRFDVLLEFLRSYCVCAYGRSECASGRIFSVTCFDSENGTVEVSMEVAFEGHLTVEW
jgi:hypothetical protein